MKWQEDQNLDMTKPRSPFIFPYVFALLNSTGVSSVVGPVFFEIISQTLSIFRVSSDSNSFLNFLSVTFWQHSSCVQHWLRPDRFRSTSALAFCFERASPRINPQRPVCVCFWAVKNITGHNRCCSSCSRNCLLGLEDVQKFETRKSAPFPSNSNFQQCDICDLGVRPEKLLLS